MRLAWFDVEVLAEQRTSMGVGGQKSFLTRTHPYLPGSVLRGALAAAWRNDGGALDADFTEAFDGEVRFGPLMPDGVSVEPQSVTRCKYHDGATADHEQDRDRAFEPGRPKGCDGPPESLTGQFVGADGRPVDLVQITSTAINPSTGAAQDGRLFSRAAHRPHTRFTGHIVGDFAVVDRLTGLHRILLGGRRSVLGSATIGIRPGEARVIPTGDRLVLRTQSPTFLVDAAGRPSLDLRHDLESLGFEVLGCWAERAVADATGGWHAASGLPKPREIGLAAGATAVITHPGTEAALRLLDRGLGLRRAEGFGWIDAPLGPWRAGRPTIAATPSSAYEDLAAEVLALGLTADLRSWLADRLLDVDPGQEAAASAALARPRARRLSLPQRMAVARLLLTMAPPDRAAIADRLRREAR